MVKKFFDYVWRPIDIQPTSLKFLFFDWIFMSLLLILIGYFGTLVFSVVLGSVFALIGVDSIIIEYTITVLFSLAGLVFTTHTSATITNKIFKKDLVS